MNKWHKIYRKADSNLIFYKINDNSEETKTHPRNLAAGSVRQLNASIARDRNKEELEKLEKKKLSLDFDYSQVPNLRKEAIQKLNEYQPASIGQASRISGVSPADISVLLIYLNR